MEVDLELLIVEVRDHPELWDCALPDYKSITKRDNAWTSVAQVCFPDFDSVDLETQKKQSE